MRARTGVDTGFRAFKWLAFGVPMDVMHVTWKHEEKSLADLPDVQNHWIDLFRSLSAAYGFDYLASKNTWRQFVTLLRSLSWITAAVVGGAYESAARDLRFVLEDMCQAMYLDTTCSQLPPQDDMYLIVRRRKVPRGRRLVRAVGLPSEIESEVCAIYNQLSDYVHPSYAVLIENIEDPKVVLFYNSQWFSNIMRIYRRVCDFVLCTMLGAFPNARADFMNKPHDRTSLEQMSFRLTLRGE